MVEGKAKVEEKKHATKRKIDALKEKIEHLIKNENGAPVEDLKQGELELKKTYDSLHLSPMEIDQFEREFADLKSSIFDKKNSATPEELEELYVERSSHIEVIKGQIERYRKAMGGSNLDFEKAMIYRELYDSAKMHLDKEVAALETLQEKLL